VGVKIVKQFKYLKIEIFKEFIPKILPDLQHRFMAQTGAKGSSSRTGHVEPL
jgi:hypothetical protein